MNICSRVKFIRESLDLTQGAFAARMGLSQSFVSNVEKNRTKFTVDHIISITNIFKIDAHWLLTGEGEMRRGAQQLDPVVDAPIPISTERQAEILHHKLQRIIENGTKVDIEAVKGMLKAFDPAMKSESMKSSGSEVQNEYSEEDGSTGMEDRRVA